MDLKTAKLILQNEVSDEHADNHDPLSNKYSRNKIIDYLWASDAENKDRASCMDWLKDLYGETEMTEDEMCEFTLEVELALETIERKPLNLKYHAK